MKAGETVKAGQGLLVIEAMKMQTEFARRNPDRGKLLASEGQPVNAGETLASRLNRSQTQATTSSAVYFVGSAENGELSGGFEHLPQDSSQRAIHRASW